MTAQATATTATTARSRTRTVTRRSISGAELGEVELDPGIFGIEPNRAVLHQVVTAQLAAARSGTQSTKTRAEVRGGGAKPFRQKGTGRSRQGSIRSPQWVGGGVALGPKPRSYAQRTPKKMIRLALCSALSDRAAGGRVAVVDSWSFDAPSTKAAIRALADLELSGRVLIVIAEDDGIAERSFANLPEIQSVLTGELNAYDVLANDWVVFTDATLPDGAGPPEVGDGPDVGDGPKARAGAKPAAAQADDAEPNAEASDTEPDAAGEGENAGEGEEGT